ncbi:hypothetical protein QBC40DRAFT_302322 [Triangularia verruculosa]|uniref:Uncharacterized protein n=1 Tax=Triangularia verruculosa TaxID=2587418 RepID=A0AAN7AP32_9PEZI|nr:hypothetical protein QBC40DRAFT_302322 [Triangularia verruculosa]
MAINTLILSLCLQTFSLNNQLLKANSGLYQPTTSPPYRPATPIASHHHIPHTTVANSTQDTRTAQDRQNSVGQYTKTPQCWPVQDVIARDVSVRDVTGRDVTDRDVTAGDILDVIPKQMTSKHKMQHQPLTMTFKASTRPVHSVGRCQTLETNPGMRIRRHQRVTTQGPDSGVCISLDSFQTQKSIFLKTGETRRRVSEET